jgi:Domain of unknown function (DUF4345)
MDAERRALQMIVAVASLVPIIAGASGFLIGPAMVGIVAAPIGADSHFSYLSGLLLGIGLGFLTTIPHIENRSRRVRLLAIIVVIGGLARLLALGLRGHPTGPTLFALAMELLVTPCLALWQSRVARRAGFDA